MNRNEFIKILGLGAVASVVPGGSDQKIVSESSEHNLEELYQIMMERKPFKIGGVEFIMTDISQDFYGDIQFGHGVVNLSASIVSTGKGLDLPKSGG